MEWIALDLIYLPAKFSPDLSSGSKVMTGTMLENAPNGPKWAPKTMLMTRYGLETLHTVY